MGGVQLKGYTKEDIDRAICRYLREPGWKYLSDGEKTMLYDEHSRLHGNVPSLNLYKDGIDAGDFKEDEGSYFWEDESKNYNPLPNFSRLQIQDSIITLFNGKKHHWHELDNDDKKEFLDEYNRLDGNVPSLRLFRNGRSLSDFKLDTNERFVLKSVKERMGVEPEPDFIGGYY